MRPTFLSDLSGVTLLNHLDLLFLLSIYRNFTVMKTNYTTLLVLFIISLFCQTLAAQEQAKPKSGEGVSAFLKRHGYTGKAAHSEFRELNKSKLTKDGGLMMGRTYRLPTATAKAKTSVIGTTITEPLFGKSLEKVTIKSNELSGACLYLVSGHGGPDPGAIGRVNGKELHEDEYAYDIVLRLARSLMEKGAKVHIIIQDKKDGIRNDRYLSNSKRETCMGRAIPLDQTQRLKQRCATINQLYKKDKEKYKRAIFVHVDSRRKKEQIDVFFYHAPNSNLGKRLATNIHKTVEAKYDRHQPNRGFTGTVSTRPLYVLRKSTPVATFLELGNIQNEKDRKRLIIYNNRQALADWICQGVVKDFKNK